jgi:hypothetical protein
MELYLPFRVRFSVMGFCPPLGEIQFKPKYVCWELVGVVHGRCVVHLCVRSASTHEASFVLTLECGPNPATLLFRLVQNLAGTAIHARRRRRPKPCGWSRKSRPTYQEPA